MMKSPGEDVGRGPDAEQGQADQRWDCEIETAAPIRLQVCLQTVVSFPVTQAVPILLFEMKPDMAMNLLARLGAADTETRAQYGVALHHPFPSLSQPRAMDFLRQPANDLFDTDAGTGRVGLGIVVV
jgi:hypothetical protein